MRSDRFGDYEWVPLLYWEFTWRHWGLEFGVSVGSWLPAEYTVHIGIGPFRAVVGIEKEYDR